jgi:hypothetical protein
LVDELAASMKDVVAYLMCDREALSYRSVQRVDTHRRSMVMALEHPREIAVVGLPNDPESE